MNLKQWILENKLILLLLLVFFIVKLFFITTRYHMPIWDEAVYIGMGKYIYSLGAMGYWEIIRPIGLPLFLGFFWKMGLNALFFGQLVGLFFSLASILMVYILAQKLFKHVYVSLLAAFLLGVAPLFFLYSTYVLTEIPSAFFVLLALYFYFEKRWFLSGLSAGISVLFRFQQGLFIAILLLGILIEYIQLWRAKTKKSKKFIDLFKPMIQNGFFCVLGFVLILAPYLIFNYIFYQPYTGTFTDALFRPFILAFPHQSNPFEAVVQTGVASHIYNLLYYPLMLLKNNLLFIFILAAIFFYFYTKEYRDQKLNILFIAFLVYLAYFTVIINKQERFLLMFFGICILLSVYGIYSLFKSRNKSILIFGFCVVTLFLFIFTSIAAMVLDSSYYLWEYPNDKKPAIIADYYQYFTTHNIKGSILATDPVIGVYTDNRLIGYLYNEQTNKLVVLNEWEQNVPVEAVAYFDKALPCLKGDTACLQKRSELLNNFNSTYTLAYTNTYYDTNYYIFLAKQT